MKSSRAQTAIAWTLAGLAGFVLVWVAAFLRKPEIFIDQKELVKN